MTQHYHRERQDADGQMKELQDQLEAEQYFSVSSKHINLKIVTFVELKKKIAALSGE